MPIINSARRINPLDLNKNVKIGVAFPLDEENMFSGTETVKEQIQMAIQIQIQIHNSNANSIQIAYEFHLDQSHVSSKFNEKLVEFIEKVMQNHTKINENQSKNIENVIKILCKFDEKTTQNQEK